jgi:hypothetical protein
MVQRNGACGFSRTTVLVHSALIPSSLMTGHHFSATAFAWPREPRESAARGGISPFQKVRVEQARLSNWAKVVKSVAPANGHATPPVASNFSDRKSNNQTGPSRCVTDVITKESHAPCRDRPEGCGLRMARGSEEGGNVGSSGTISGADTSGTARHCVCAMSQFPHRKTSRSPDVRDDHGTVSIALNCRR